MGFETYFEVLGYEACENRIFWDFGSLEDSSGSVRRKRVPQVRAREDNQCGYRGSPGLVKMDLTRVLTEIWLKCFNVG